MPAKTLPPGVVELPHGSFRANVVPDVFDERDLVYRPRLQPLPPARDVRPEDQYVLEQQGNSCTGHAVAAMVNAVLAAQGDAVHVSPYMLYRLARRYDEFEGEEDEGSSLRGALKGWYYHGVLPDEAWPRLDPSLEPDIDSDPALADLAMRRPLGAFYRVNPFRLDDMQSAVNELQGIVASAAVHEGWVRPTPVEREGSTMYIIEKPVAAAALGGHAFAIVGYNEVGFLVQNSWGREWGRKGFATLPYDDWLQSAYDAWIARPGVHSIVSLRNQTKVVSLDGVLAEGPGPDITRLKKHVINLGNNGTLSAEGRFVSTPAQVNQVFERMADYHRFWLEHPADGGAPEPSRVVLYAHGGLNSERTGLTIAHRQLNWWLNNRVYPVTFAWQSGAAETLLNHLADTAGGRLPSGGVGFNLVEQFDRLVENLARSRLRWMWEEMKENAALASLPIPAGQEPTWPPEAHGGRAAVEGLPGASLAVSRLARYVDALAADGATVEVHLVAHSAGSIFLAALLPRLEEAHVPVASLTYLAPAIRTDVWMTQVLPHLRTGHVGRFASFGLSQSRELDDVCGAGGVNVYHKSLLYLVSRALERSRLGTGEVPLVGLQHLAGDEVGGSTLQAEVEQVGGELLWAPSDRGPGTRSDSRSHGGFDDDSPTMTSVLQRITSGVAAGDRATFVPYAPLTGPGVPEGPARPAGERAPLPPTVDVKPAGVAPPTSTAPPRTTAPQVPAAPGDLPESPEAQQSSSPIMDALVNEGWARAGAPEDAETDPGPSSP